MKNSFAMIAMLFTLTGCVVQPVTDASYVQPNPTVKTVPTPIEGVWQLRERGRFIRSIDVHRVQGGIEIGSGNGRSFAQRIDRRVFQDNQGRIYAFFSGSAGRFENVRNGRRMRLVRP